MTLPINPGGIAVGASQAQKTVEGAAGAVKDAASAATSGLGDITDSVRAVRLWISNRHNWVRTAWFLSGAAMFTIGVVMLGDRPAEHILSTADKIAKAVPKDG